MAQIGWRIVLGRPWCGFVPLSLPSAVASWARLQANSLQNGVTNRHIGQRDTRHETVDKNRSYSVLTCLLLRAASSVHGPWFRWLYARRLDNRAVEDLISTEGPKQFLV
jgi:hypothetical protein